MAFNGIPEVLEETIVPFALTGSIRLKRSFLICRFSTTTSMIQSISAILSKSSSKLPIEIRSISFFCINKEGLDPKTASRPAFAIRFLAAGSFFSASFKSKGTMSSSNVLTPAAASKAAIPPPITPEPITAAVLIFLLIMTS